MAVQLPRLNRIAPQATPTQGRIEMRPLDVVSGVEQTNKQIAAFGDNQADQMARAENNAAEVKATQVSTDFEGEYQAGLEEIRKMKGDPTVAYQEFDATMKKRFDALAGEYVNASGYMKNAVLNKLSITGSRLQQKRTINESSQYKAYQRETIDAAVGLIADQGVLDAVEIDVASGGAAEGNFTNLTMSLDRIRQTRDQAGRADGLISVDKNGNEVRSAILVDQIKQDTSTALGNAIKSLNAAGKTKEATAVLEKYRDDILAKTRLDLMKKTKEEGLNQEALQLESKTRHMDAVDAQEFIDKSNASLEVKQKARGFSDERNRQMKLATERRSKQTYDTLFKEVVNLGESPSLTQLHEMPTWKEMSDNLLPEQRKAIEVYVQNPKYSNQDSKIRMMELVDSGDIAKLDPTQLVQQMSGLNSSDRNRYESIHRQLRGSSGTESVRMIRSMDNYLVQQLAVNKIVPNAQKSSWLKKRKASEAYFEYYEGMLDIQAALPANASQAEMMKAVKDYVSQKKATGNFTVPTSPKFNPGKGATPKTATVETRNATGITPANRSGWITQWSRENKRKFNPQTDEQSLIDFVNSKESQ